MDFSVWCIAVVLSFALTIMAVKDRTLGIGGIGIMFVTTALAGNDNAIVMASGFDSSGNPLTRTVAFQPEFLVLGFVIIAIEVVLLFELNDRYAPQEYEESGMLEDAFT